jgi:pSer/pThr/pTyr-binding forkhead associated (FHA) protein
MAILELLDDGSDRGEEFRVRTDAVTIGRVSADILIPHDTQISGCHVRLSRQPVNGEFHWVLEDLASTNGTFLRVAKAVLQPSTPFIIGSHRYVYRPAAAAAAVERTPTAPVGTRGWQAPSAEEIQRQWPALVRIIADGTEQVFPFQTADVAIGSDPAVTNITITDDPTVNGLHGHIRTTEKGRVIEDNKSLNGLWIAISERRLNSTATFQIGEQRIRFRVL